MKMKTLFSLRRFETWAGPLTFDIFPGWKIWGFGARQKGITEGVGMMNYE